MALSWMKKNFHPSRATQQCAIMRSRPAADPSLGDEDCEGEEICEKKWRWGTPDVFVLLLAVLAFTFCPLIHSQRIHSMAGPFRVIPDHIEHCPPAVFQKEELAKWHFRAYRDRQNIDIWYYFGNYTLYFNFNDSEHVEMNFASWSSRGGWKDNAIVLKFRRICTTGRTYLPSLWKIIMSSVLDDNNKTRPDCPFPPGNYKLNHAKADLGTARKVPAFFYGKWRMDFHIVNMAWETISCMRIFLRTVPLVHHGSLFGANNQDLNETQS